MDDYEDFNDEAFWLIENMILGDEGYIPEEEKN